jgi:hypothetical protein
VTPRPARFLITFRHEFSAHELFAGEEMKIFRGFLTLLPGLMLAGCTTEPEEYKELRVDAFSHYWATQKMQRVSKPGNRLVMYDLDSNGTGYVDTIVLVKASDDKTAQLPAHSYESVDSWSSRLVYAGDREPQDFSCYYDNGGRRYEQSETPPPLFDLRWAYRELFEGEVVEGIEVDYWYASQVVPQVLMPISCGYMKGKGFYLGYIGFDEFGREPRAAAGGTFIIRYR